MNNLENIMPLSLAPMNGKYLGIYLTKYMQDLYKENYKTDKRFEKL